MEISSGIQASLAGRYATALFGLAQDQDNIAGVETSLGILSRAMTESKALRDLTINPLISREASSHAIAALASAMGIDPLTTQFLGVLAQNRRLAALSSIIAAFAQLAAAHRGETTAQVTSAHPLGEAQITALKAKLKTRVGRDVAVQLFTDPAILGGLIVKIGSQMIDSSIRTKLNTLAVAMKG